jgi:hypothetical protein
VGGRFHPATGNAGIKEKTMLKRIQWIVQFAGKHLWRIRTLEMLAPLTLARIHERNASALRDNKPGEQTPVEFADELMALVTESHQTWLSPEEGHFLAEEINQKIKYLLRQARREKQRAVESAIATDLALETSIKEE